MVSKRDSKWKLLTSLLKGVEKKESSFTLPKLVKLKQ